jgi:hypothetical protein
MDTHMLEEICDLPVKAYPTCLLYLTNSIPSRLSAKSGRRLILLDLPLSHPKECFSIILPAIIREKDHKTINS